MLAGSLVSGVQLAVSMSNTGGAWDNAKKYIEAGATEHARDLGGKGSDCHKAAVIGDTVSGSARCVHLFLLPCLSSSPCTLLAAFCCPVAPARLPREGSPGRSLWRLPVYLDRPLYHGIDSTPPSPPRCQTLLNPQH